MLHKLTHLKDPHNGRYFLKFNGSQKIISQVDLNNDVVNVFIVYRLTSRGSAQSFWCNGLFGHDNGGHIESCGIWSQ